MRSDVRPALLPLALKTVVTHAVTYFAIGLLASTLLRYDRWFAKPPLDAYMRPVGDRWDMAGPRRGAPVLAAAPGAAGGLRVAARSSGKDR